MSAETFVNALFLITAVVAAGILITAVFPIVWNMASTFSAASHESDTRMRTDFKIVTYYANAKDQVAHIYLKNIGSSRISVDELQNSDVFYGMVGNFSRLAYTSEGTVTWGKWAYIGYNGTETSYDRNMNMVWETGETIQIIAIPEVSHQPNLNDFAYFQFIIPNGVWRSVEFLVS